MATPKNIALIIDGNGRWARKHNKRSELLGHTQGLFTLRVIIEAAFKRGVTNLAVWLASTSNFDNREEMEMRHLARLLKFQIRHQSRSPEDGRLRVRGDWRKWIDDPALDQLVADAEHETRHYKARQLWVLFGYDAKSDDRQARYALYKKGLEPSDENLEAHLWTAGLPNMDLIIRTGHENDIRDSDPFLWRHRTNTHWIWSPVLWPDFTIEHLDQAFDEFHRRPKRNGGRTPKQEPAQLQTTET